MNEKNNEVWVISGASGLIAKEVIRHLQKQNIEIRKLVRREALDETEWYWDPESLYVNPRVFENASVVLNLSGASISKFPWTNAYKKELIDSRIKSTRTLCEGIRKSGVKLKCFISASGTGIYPSAKEGEGLLDENSPAGTGFLASLVKQWEETALELSDITRVVCIRTALVMSPSGGIYQKLAPVLSKGLVAKFGPGSNVWPWISIVDEAKAIKFCADNNIQGPVNLASPQITTQKEILYTLIAENKKTFDVSLPRSIVSLALPDAQALFYDSQPLSVKKLSDAGFVWEHPDTKSLKEFML